MLAAAGSVLGYPGQPSPGRRSAWSGAGRDGKEISKAHEGTHLGTHLAKKRSWSELRWSVLGFLGWGGWERGMRVPGLRGQVDNESSGVGGHHVEL